MSKLEITYNLKYFKQDHHVGFVPIESNLLPLIGKVAVYWGHFEVQFDDVIAAMIKASGPLENPLWRTSPFRKRRNQFRQLVKTCFAADSAIRKHLLAVAQATADIYPERNLVVHGNYIASIPPMGSVQPITYRAKGFHNRKPVDMPISFEQLDKLWHDIANLMGSLTGSFEADDTFKHELALPDRRRLQAFWAKNRPTAPKKPTQRRQPRT